MFIFYGLHSLRDVKLIFTAIITLELRTYILIYVANDSHLSQFSAIAICA